MITTEISVIIMLSAIIGAWTRAHLTNRQHINGFNTATGILGGLLGIALSIDATPTGAIITGFIPGWVINDLAKSLIKLLRHP